MESKKAVVYARVSTDHDDQIHSFKSQQEYYSKYAIENGFELMHIYADEGISATSANRKEFLQMLYDAGLDAERKENSGVYTFDTSYREPKFNWIILKDVSRFARNSSATEIAKRLVEKGVYIIFENMGFSTKEKDWVFRFNLLVTFAEQESIDRSMKGKKAYEIKSHKGDYHMSNILLGYQRNPETKEYEINEDEAKIVIYIFNLYVNHGMGSTEIADMCNKKGYRTKKGKRFTSSSVSRIIKNEKFKGQVITNRYGRTGITGSYKRIELPKEEWDIHDNAIPNIISVEMFDKAQEIRIRRILETKNHGRKGKKVPKSEFYKKIHCGKCGSDYVRLSSKKKRVNLDEKITEYFYSCRKRRNKMRLDDTCDNKGIAHSVLVRELTSIGEILHYRFNQVRIEDEEAALKRLLGKLDKKLKTAKSEVEIINNQISELDKQIENITNSIANGVSESVQRVMFEKIDKIESDKNKLKASILEFDTIKIENQKEDYKEKFKEVVKFSKKKLFTYEEVVDLVYNIYVMPSRDVLVELLPPTLLFEDDEYINEQNPILDNYKLFPFSFKLR